MTDVVVSDATSLIVLEKLYRLDLIEQLFDKVIIPDVVMAEVRRGSKNQGMDFDAYDCFQTTAVASSERLDQLLSLLDPGEANAIELAASRNLPLIIDERKGRDIAQQMGLRITGFAGLLILSRRRGLMAADEADQLLSAATENGLYLSDALLAQVNEQLTQG